MSVRNRLIEAFVQDNWQNPLFSREKTEAWVDSVLAEHAHELAEEVRDFAARRLQIDSDDETYGMRMAADLIDPNFEETCPYTFSHTRHWCGYDTCRES